MRATSLMVKLPIMEGYMYYYHKWTISPISQNFSSSRRNGSGELLSHQASIGELGALLSALCSNFSRSIALKNRSHETMPLSCRSGVQIAAYQRDFGGTL